MSPKNRWTMCGVLPALLVLATAIEVEAARFHFLGRAFGPRIYRRVSDVSADGTTAVGSLDYDDFMSQYTHLLRWNADGELLPAGDFGGAGQAEGELLPADNFEGALWGVSADGSVVVGRMGGVAQLRFAPTGEAFRWAAGGGMVGLGYLTEGATYSSASAASADGSTVVGQSGSDSGNRAFRWTQSEGMVGLGMLLGHDESRADSVSADGSVIVGSSSSGSVYEAFRWTADGIVGLGRLGEHLDSYAKDVSADGSVVVGYSGNRNRSESHLFPMPPGTPEPPDEGYEAFAWTETDGMVGLGCLPGHGWSKAYAASGDGSIVVGVSYPFDDHGMGPAEAFIWDAEHGMRSLRDLLTNEYQLELPDWPLGHPTGISADGKVIVGNGVSNAGMGGAWMVVIPEPSTIVLALTGLFGLLVCAWRRRRRAA